MLESRERASCYDFNCGTTMAFTVKLAESKHKKKKSLKTDSKMLNSFSLNFDPIYGDDEENAK